jgi:hypothetical protein
MQHLVLRRLLAAHLPYLLEAEIEHLLQQLNVLRRRSALEVGRRHHAITHRHGDAGILGLGVRI